ncbi:unnamed protein product [Schistosoma margrebowiei]|uniref:Uncharacterized protein n=1 Tax=Schistosoma margrebowiei TaxID=48269 RepID=A0A183LE21_9TREM|nr:unnamed protein product [Schistosoma margrebowiei]
MQEKPTSIAVAIDLNIHIGKTKILRYNTTCTNEITVYGEASKVVKTSKYVCSNTDVKHGCDADVKPQIGKVRGTYLHLKNILKSKQLSINIKVRIFNTNVKTILMYATETWRTITNFYQQFSTQNTSDRLVRHYQHQPTVGEKKADPSGGRNQKKAL